MGVYESIALGVEEDEGVYGMFMSTCILFLLVSWVVGGRDKSTRRSISSANFASRMVVSVGKASVDMLYAAMSFGREERAGEWVMRWMGRVEVVGRAMYVDRFADPVEEEGWKVGQSLVW